MDRTVTALAMERGQKGLVAVYLDGEYAFSLGLASAASLRKGQRLGDEDVDGLKSRDEALRAFDHAVRFLSYRSRTRSETELFLEQAGYGPDAVASAVRRLLEARYLDDEAFAEAWVDSRERSNPRSVDALRRELIRKGIDETTADTAVQGLDEESSGLEGPGTQPV